MLLANFDAMCLLMATPHVWAGYWFPELGEWSECSYAATNENGTPTHWAPVPEAPTGLIESIYSESRTRFDELKEQEP
jgi:hypothetical protein